MNHWFTQADAPVVTTHVKRFDPLHWTVNFPRGTIASLVTATDGHGMGVDAEFLRRGDLVGLIFASEDGQAHPAHARETAVDYSGTTLSFRWQSSGVMPLDLVNGPTLTIEGRDSAGQTRSWFVRLWNYAQGTGNDAIIALDFDALDGGFLLPDEADRVDPTNIERMFISIIPPDYVELSQEVRPAPAVASVTVSELRCDGANSVLLVRDAVVPEHGLRIATAYDDMYNLPPERVVDSIERLGFRGTINHYVGMSHYFGLDAAGRLDPARPLNGAALAWHRDFARAAAARGYKIIWSLSFEILAMFCPEAWKQRDFGGSPGLTGWDPPSALVSPANGQAIAFLGSVLARLAQISVEFGLQPKIQVGEPWWWVTPGGDICLYDDAAKAAFGGNPVEIADVRQAMTAPQLALLDEAGELMAAATEALCDAARAVVPATKTHLLIYLPTILDPAAPELRRANVPLGWARPAFDVLQLEDYEWVTGGLTSQRAAARAVIDSRLGYPVAEQHYLSGFVADPAGRQSWGAIIAAAVDAQSRGVAEVFLWALPQVLRDGLTVFGDADVIPFDDISFPIEIGAEASVSPAFSTNVVTSASGAEYRNVNWQQGRLRFDAGPGVRGDQEVETLLAFFRARRGAAIGFRFRDPFDFSSNGMSGTPSALDQQIGVGNGSSARFTLKKTYDDGEERRITRPVAGTVRVAVDGAEQASGWTLEALGEIVFAAPPAGGATVTAGFEFDVPVRFADDQLEVNRATFRAGEAPSVPLIEVKEG